MNLPYYSPETARANVGVQESGRETFGYLIDFLSDEDLIREIKEGNLTLAMIRPGLETATNIDGGDIQIAETLEEHIQSLGVNAKFAITFDEQAIEEFYESPKQAMLQHGAKKNSDLDNQWEEFKAMMTAGPTTVLLLHSHGNDATRLWREQVGHWNIEKNRDPNTIRGQFGIDNYNNLVHGSDAPESVLREIAIIASCLNRKALIAE